MTNRLAESHSTLIPKAAAPNKRPSGKMDDLREMLEPLQGLVLKYPSVALASAFLVGVAIAWWIKRR